MSLAALEQLRAAHDRLMPMHLVAGPDGSIRHAGPTLMRLRPPGALVGRPFDEAFRLRKPHKARRFADLAAAEAARVVVQFAEPPETEFNGLAIPLGGGALLLNLAFGISILAALEAYDLHSADFAPTDLTVDMLYLLEAKSALMEESRRLNKRLQAARIAAEEQAFTDTLTGLKNRRALFHVADRYAAIGQPFGLVQMDLDHFKAVNDSLGHAAGDHVLQTVAGHMVRETRAGDTIVRAGGDEFLLLLPNLTDGAELIRLARRLIARIEQPIPFDGAVCRVSASAGISIETGDYGHALDEHLRRSDMALYLAKESGRGRAALYEEAAEPGLRAAGREGGGRRPRGAAGA